MSRVDVRLLGPLRVAVDGQRCEVGKGNERLLIAALALAGGRPVSTESIIDLLWPERAPRTAREMVRIYVRRVRARLDAAAVETTGAGYALATDEEHVDALRFERLAAGARRALGGADGSAALNAIDEALALWAGPALADFDGAPFVRDERARLDELRVGLLEDRGDAQLASGESVRLVADLESLVREYPYRERLRGQLMLALYRDGRQTEALAQFQETRAALVETFGVEPGRELQELHLALLRQDPELDAPRRRPVGDGAPPSGPAGPARTRRRGAVAASIAVVVVAAIVGALLGTGSGRSSRPQLAAASLAALDSRSGKVARVQRSHGFPTVVGADGRHVWFGDGRRDLVSEVDDDLRTPVRSVRLSTFPYRIVVGLGAAWIADGYRGTVVRMDAATGRATPIAPDPRGLGRVQLALGGGALWTASQDGRLTRTRADGSSSTVVATRVGQPEALAYGFGDLWVAEEDTLLRLDAARPSVRRRIPIGGIGESIAVADGSIWVATPDARAVWRIDPRTSSVLASVPVAGRPTVVAAGPDAVWVGSATGSLARIDPGTNRVVQTIAAHGPVGGLTLLGNELVATIS